MVMNRPKGFGIPAVQGINPEREVTKLITSDKPEDFATMLQFLSPEESDAYGDCVFKCKKYGLKSREAYYHFQARARCSVLSKDKGSNRADKFSMTLMGVAVPDAYGGGGENKHGSRDSNKQNP